MMSDTKFDARLAEIDAGYGTRREAADAYRDQELARLFAECEWTQDRIAKKMGRRQSWVSKRLTFGRFLDFIPPGNNSGKQALLTEKRFRQCWSRTRGKEQDRFAEVARMLNQDALPQSYRNLQSKPGVAAALRESLADGQWHWAKDVVAEITAAIPEATQESVYRALGGIQRHPPKGHFVESKHCGKQHQYRLRKGRGNEIGAEQMTKLVDGILPVIDELREWGGKHESHQSPVALRQLAEKLERLVKPLLETAAP